MKAAAPASTAWKEPLTNDENSHPVLTSSTVISFVQFSPCDCWRVPGLARSGFGEKRIRVHHLQQSPDRSGAQFGTP